ncbi:MAG: recombinase family protein [Glutamicibacter arilaitensis]|uniref:recombinase family protein n=1 Tax=Glutamicibacter arilaitensis TaxID=256701 RepID=UPI003FD0CE5C
MMYIKSMGNDMKNTRAVIYARISRDKKDGGSTLDGQIDLCQKLAERHGLTVVGQYREADGTGASEKSSARNREEYDAMLKAAEAGEFEYILAYADDRLTRRPTELEQLIGLVDKTGLKIRTVRTEHYDLSTTQGITTARILGAVAAGEARTISDRQKITFERNAYEGKPKLQRQRPFGWEEDGSTLREPEAQLIREAVEEVKAGATIASIRHKWNQAGIKTAVDPEQSKKVEKPDGQWGWSVVSRTLLGWRTAGVRTYKRKPLRDTEGELVMGTWEPIISLQDRTEALAALSRHSRIKLRTGSWPLASLLRCGECTKPLYGQLPTGTRNRATYSCKNGHVGISAGLLEQYLISESIQRAYRAIESGQAAQETKSKETTDWPKLSQLQALSFKMNEIMEAYRKDRLPGAIAFEQVDELEKERKQLQLELDDFLKVDGAPPSQLRRTSEALEWLQGVQGQFLRVTPKKAKVGESQPWGANDESSTPSGERKQEVPDAANEEETAELN